MTDRETGGPAFPTDSDDKNGPPSTWSYEGMTLRDYFAAKAMQALIAKAPLRLFTDSDDDERGAMEKSITGGAYEYADAMLKERAK